MYLAVITHNGKPPSEGGLRLGYQAGNRVYWFGGPLEGVEVRPAVAPKPKLAFYDLPVASHRDYCHRCDNRSLHTRTVDTDCGPKVLLVCSLCNKQHRQLG